MTTAPGAALKAAAGHAYTGGLQAAAIASAVVLGALAVLIFTGLRVAADPAHAAMPSCRPPRNRVRASPRDQARRRASRSAIRDLPATTFRTGR